ncbi:MAG TPA: cytochrome c [Planctomycetota bacterium]|jgi:mono/diheme cytochrome c family protein|nr:cytochrome c [Planctomycetota bacterium]
MVARRLGVVAFAFLVACEQAMTDEGRLKPLGRNAFFEYGQSARPRPAGTVARGERSGDALLETGRLGGELSPVFPFPVDRAALERGRARYGVFCAPCHDAVGTGAGMIVQRGFRAPPSFHTDRLRRAPPGHFFEVITRGVGAMPAYDDLIAPRRRWEIVAYVRALQLSQGARREDVPPDVLRRLEAP